MILVLILTTLDLIILIFINFFINQTKKNGVIIKVKTIENKIPDISTIPMVNLDSYPAPDLITRGITPTIVDIPVIIIGLNLFLQRFYNSA